MTKEEILEKIFEPSRQDCQTYKEDLQLAITLNPDLDKILEAMQSYADQETTDLTNKLKEREEEISTLKSKVQDCMTPIISAQEEHLHVLRLINKSANMITLDGYWDYQTVSECGQAISALKALVKPSHKTKEIEG